MPRRRDHRPVTDDDRARILELHAQGVTRNDIARQTGRSAATVTKTVHAAGLTFDRASTKAATEARKTDLAERRSQLELQLLEDASRLRAQIWQPHTYIDHGGKDFVQVTWTQDEPSPADKLKLMQSASTAIDRSLKISDHNSGRRDEATTSLLSELGHRLGINDSSGNR
jgi:hypothetical protein